MSLRRADSLSVGKGVVASYIHNAMAPGVGRIGVLVALESEGAADKLEALGKQLAMHIAAARPEWLSDHPVDSASPERAPTLLAEQAPASGKPEYIIATLAEGGWTE